MVEIESSARVIRHFMLIFNMHCILAKRDEVLLCDSYTFESVLVQQSAVSVQEDGNFGWVEREQATARAKCGPSTALRMTGSLGGLEENRQ